MLKTVVKTVEFFLNKKHMMFFFGLSFQDLHKHFHNITSLISLFSVLLGCPLTLLASAVLKFLAHLEGFHLHYTEKVTPQQYWIAQARLDSVSPELTDLALMLLAYSPTTASLLRLFSFS
jgi:hypothetical protein